MVIIYSASWCAPCRFAKQLLNEKGVKFNEIDIEKEGISRQGLEKLTGGSTVPQICINNEYIGGYDALLALEQSGKLDKLLWLQN